MFNYGFRFFVLAKKDDKYAIRDLKDNSTEWLSYNDVIKASKSVRIVGVDNNKIDLDWIYGYIAKAFMSLPVIEFVRLFNLTLIDGDICFAQEHVADKELGETRDFYPFLELITSCKCYVYFPDKNGINCADIDTLPPVLMNQILRTGIDFSRLSKNGQKINLGNFPLNCYDRVNLSSLVCNNICVSFEALKEGEDLDLRYSVWERWKNKFNRMEVFISAHNLYINSLEKGIFYYFYAERNFYISDRILEYVNTNKGYYVDFYNVPNLVKLQSDKYVYKLIDIFPDLNRILFFNYEVNDVVYKFKLIDCLRYVRNGINKFDISFDKDCRMFYMFHYDDRYNITLNIPSVVFNEIALESHDESFLNRHGISWDNFKRISRVTR